MYFNFKEFYTLYNIGHYILLFVPRYDMSSELIKPPSTETLERVRGEFGLNEERVREAVEHLKDWIQLQPHLPKEIGKLAISTPQSGTFHCNPQNTLLK
jgi:hypothetical protein